MVVFSLLIGITGFMVVEKRNFIDAFYLTTITLSTVGFGTLGELSQAGKLFISFYIIINLTVFAFVISIVTRYVFEGRLKKFLNKYIISSSVKKLSDHVIVCGLGRNGDNVCKEFRDSNIPYIALDLKEEAMKSGIDGGIVHPYYLVGDATDDETLIKAGIHKAKAIVASMHNDSDNVFVTLTARQLNPSISIIAKAAERSTEKKLYTAGVDHVVMPDVIGGFYMASMVSKPNVVEFLENINGIGEQRKIKLEEFCGRDFKSEYQDSTIKILNIRSRCGVTIIGIKNRGTKDFIFNPSLEEVIYPNSEIIALGKKENILKFKEIYID